MVTKQTRSLRQVLSGSGEIIVRGPHLPQWAEGSRWRGGRRAADGIVAFSLLDGIVIVVVGSSIVVVDAPVRVKGFRHSDSAEEGALSGWLWDRWVLVESHKKTFRRVEAAIQVI